MLHILLKQGIDMANLRGQIDMSVIDFKTRSPVDPSAEEIDRRAMALLRLSCTNAIASAAMLLNAAFGGKFLSVTLREIEKQILEHGKVS